MPETSKRRPDQGRRCGALSWRERTPRQNTTPMRLGCIKIGAPTSAPSTPRLWLPCPTLLARWLPDGRREGNEYVARNPRRHDRHPGSFKINLSRGAWADFATGDRGGDVISLAAFLAGTSQGEAARELARMLGLETRR